MSIRIGKALVVDGDEITRAAANLLLTSAGQPFDYATSLVEAVAMLKANNYVCIFVASEIPAVAGATPRRQDTENLLDHADRIKGNLKPPVVCMFHEMPDMTLDNFACWVCDMTLKGVVKWVPKPFPSSGRTPDRMLKKILSGNYVRMIKAKPLTPADLMDGPLETYQRDASIPHDGVVRPSAGADAPTVVAKLKRVVAGGKDSATLLAALRRDIVVTEVAPSSAAPVAGDSAAPANPPAPRQRWPHLPNEPIDLDNFMVRFCEHRTRDNRMCRKRALLAAARHETVKLPPLAGPRKHGQSNSYMVHDLLAAWQSFIDKGVELPPLLPSHKDLAQKGAS